MTLSRVANLFNQLKNEKRPAFISYIMAFDPDYGKSLEILKSLPSSGADIIELGMPFSDPMADGVTIQNAAIRALNSGAKIHKILEMVTEFRKGDSKTPVILMGYYNPLYNYGIEKFTADAKKCGVDGLLIVDLPIEEDEDLYKQCLKNKIDLIKLITPTTQENRIKEISKKASGFLYYVSVLGVTGDKSVNLESVEKSLAKIRKSTNLPIAVGFGIKSRNDVKEVGCISDAVVVGSAIVNKIDKSNGDANIIKGFVKELSGCK